MNRKKATGVLLAMLFTLPVLLTANASFLEPFKRMMIMENGRQKPMDTFARNLLKQFSGRSSLSGQEASVWLARVLFAPRQTLNDKLFLLNHPDVLAALGIPGQGRQRYSFEQIGSRLDRLQQLAMQADRQNEKNRSIVDSEIMRLYVNVGIYHSLLNAFSFISGRESSNPEHPSSAAPILAIIPAAGAETERWQSPGEVIPDLGNEPPGIRAEINLLTTAAKAFANGRNLEFSQALAAFNQSIQKRLPPGMAGKNASLEIFYNQIDPFFKAELAYGLALVFLLLSLLVSNKFVPKLSLLFLLAGLLAHSSGLVARMIIMNRPPVTNLYETFVFVAWTGVVLGILLELFQKKSLGIMAGSVAGLLFLLIAGRYSLEGDTLGMLAAVLDSNLWLTTHVVTISVGYAGCVIAGIIGHVFILNQLFYPDDPMFRRRTARSLYAVLAFGLVFTFIGTVMGGIWADQSWGRFWGWDPKENGALLIILWCAILFHARLAGMIGQLGMAVGAVISIITVVLAWFGVNLLGVGMHSYGFTSGVARWLMAFVGAEVVFIAVSVTLIRKKLSRASLSRKHDHG